MRFILSRVYFNYRRIALGWFFLVPVLLGLYVLPLLQKGGYGDGQHYAILSNNWAVGVGDMWHMYFLDLQKFEGHPPLFFVLEGVLFWLFSDHFWVEGLFMLLLLIGKIWLFFAILRRLSLLLRTVQIWDFRFVAVLIYLLSGGIPNFYVNNFLELLLSLFTFFGCYAALRALMEYDYKKWLWYISLGIAVFLGYLTKGPVALFPLIFPIIWGLVIRRFLKGVLYSFLGFFVACFLMGLLFLCSPSAWEFMKNYHKLQVFSALLINIYPDFPQPKGRGVTAIGYLDRLWIVLKILFEQILVPSLIFLFFYFRQCWLKKRFRFILGDMIYKKTMVFFIVASLCASFPIIFSPSIAPHYFMPSHDLYCIWFFLLLLPFIRNVKIPWINFWRGFSLFVCLILLIVGIFRYGKPSRYGEIIELAEEVAKLVPRYNQIYCVDEQMQTLAQVYKKHPVYKYNANFMRYSHSILFDLSEVGYDTPNYLLLHSNYLSKYTDVLKVYTLVANLKYNFKLYKYTGSD